MLKVKFHSKLGSINMLPNLLNKKINICGFFNGNMNEVLPNENYTLLGYQGREFVIGYANFFQNEKNGELITIKTKKEHNLSYDGVVVDEKIFSYNSFSAPLENYELGFQDFYPNKSKSLVNIQSHILTKIDLYGYDAKRMVPEFLDKKDSSVIDIDLKFVHSVVLYFDRDLVLFLDADYVDSKINYMNLYIMSEQKFIDEFFNSRFLVKDDWGYLRYNLLFSY
jgi:hypothetical protein